MPAKPAMDRVLGVVALVMLDGRGGAAARVSFTCKKHRVSGAFALVVVLLPYKSVCQ